VIRLAWMLLVLLPFKAFAAPINLYAYHLQPPFVLSMEQRTGLMFEVAELLSRQVNAVHSFDVRVLPRARLNKTLAGWIDDHCAVAGATECDDNWILLWVIPAWGWGEDAEQRYLWVDLFKDEDLVVSTQQRKVAYRNANSLIGQRFAALRGHRYPQGVEELMQQGKINREDGNDVRASLMRIHSQRAEVTVIRRLAFNYYLQNDQQLKPIAADFYVAPQPFNQFTLQAMIPLTRPDLRDMLERAKADPAWGALFARYGIQAL
jgi:polar amino acid transport system substrate-binding protein